MKIGNGLYDQGAHQREPNRTKDDEMKILLNCLFFFKKKIF